MKDGLKSFAITIIILIAIIGFGAFGLHFLMPEVNYKVLIGISAVLVALLYMLIKVGSVIIKIAIAVLIVAAIIYFTL